MKRSVLYVATIGLLVLALGVACGDDDDDEETPAATTAAATTTAAGSPTEAPLTDGDPIKIGVIQSLTDRLSSVGVPSANAVTLAVEQINEDGGVVIGSTRHDLEAVIKDDRSDTTAAVAAATELLRDDGVKLIICNVASALSVSTLPIIKDSGGMAMCNLAPVNATNINNPEYEHIVKVSEAGKGQRCRYANKVVEEFDIQKVAILAIDDASGQTHYNDYGDCFMEAGAEVTRELFPSDTQDFAPLITGFATFDPDLFVFGYGVQIDNTILSEAINQDLASVYMTTTSGHIEAATGEATGTEIDFPFIAASSFPTVNIDYVVNPVRKAFAEAYLERFGEPVGSGDGSVQGVYDAVYALKSAIELAGSFDDPAVILAEFDSLTLEGLNGTDVFTDRIICYTDEELLVYRPGAGVEAFEATREC